MPVFVDEALATLLAPLGDVHPDAAPQGTEAPFIIYMQISETGEETLDGPAGLERPIFQIDVYDKRFGPAKIKAKEIEKVLRGFSGPVTVGGETLIITHISKRSERSGKETTESPILFRRTLEFRISYIDEGVKLDG